MKQDEMYEDHTGLFAVDQRCDDGLVPGGGIF